MLEIGIGTGQATRHFLERELHVTGIDIAPAMLEIAERNFQGQSCTFVHSAFEDFDARPGTFDFICAAQSFHWVDPAIAYEKTARLLNASGSLILIWSAKKILPENDVVLEQFYRDCAPSISARTEGRGAAPVNTIRRAREARTAKRDLFPQVHEISSHWEQRYTAAEYIDLLGTYSDHITLPDTEKTALFSAISEWIESVGGILSVPYETTAFIARKTANATL